MSDIDGLMAWDATGPVPEAWLSRLEASPRHAEAARALAANMLAAGAGDAALDGIFKDAGRYLVAMWAVYLHVSGGLTLPRLKEICIRSGLVSPGRARSLLVFLRYLGYVELFPARDREGPARYIPTGRCMNAWRRHLRAALEAAQVIEPGVGWLLDQYDAPEIADGFSRLHTESLFDAATPRDQDHAYFRVFLHRNAGSQVIWALLTSADDGVFPPVQPLPVTIAGLARRFGVSRAHIRRMFDEAEREGLLVCRPEGAIQLTAMGRDAIRYTYSTQLAHLLRAAAATIKARPQLARARRELGRIVQVLTTVVGADSVMGG